MDGPESGRSRRGAAKALSPRRLLLYTCFFLSGASGLVYEVLWARILGLTFGHTVYGVTTVLAAFMGGLALGSYLIGRLSDRLEDPLRLYAALELGIGLYCLVTPLLLSLTRSGFLLLYPYISANPAARTLVQFALAFLVLILPTTLMGGTLPAVTRAVVEDPRRAGREVAVLYGVNTLGAVSGALAAGYWLLPALGNLSTNRLAVAGNVTAGLAALLWLRTPRRQAAREAAPEQRAGQEDFPEAVLLVCFALSGAAAMTYQVAWTRALVLIIGSSTYAFTCILATFLSGLALGSWIFSLVRNGSRLIVLAGIQAGIALSAFVIIPLFERLPDLFFALMGGSDWSLTRILFVQFAVAASVILVPTLLMGMTFPCVTGILVKGLGRLGGDVGRYYAVNTAGAIGGAVIAGFFLIPLLGSQDTLILAIGTNITLAAVLMALARPGTAVQLGTAAAVVAVLLWYTPPWSARSLHSGVSIYGQRYSGQGREAAVHARMEGRDVLFSREGISTTVAVLGDAAGNRALLVNGKTDASNTDYDLETMVKTAFIPMILHPAPVSVAVVGMGSGVTAGVAGLFNGVETIDIVELEPAVLEAARYFHGENMGVLEDPRAAYHIDDGRSFIQGTQKRYDVILSEPSNPWISGVSALFTREFMKAAKEKLAPGGIFCMWIQGYGISPGEMKMVLRTFSAVYPGATLWQGSLFDYILIGWRDKPSIAAMADLVEKLGRHPDLERASALFPDLTADGLIDSFLLGPEEIALYAGGGPLNTDDRDILEFKAPRSLYRSSSLEVERGIWKARLAVYPPFVLPDGR